MSETIFLACFSPMREEWRWFEPQLKDKNFQWYFFNDSKPILNGKFPIPEAIKRAIASYTVVKKIKNNNCSLIFTHDPKYTFWCSFWMKILRVPIEHVAYSFNFPELPKGFKKRLMSWGFTKVDRFVMYSSFEKELYAKYFNIPPEKIDFIAWSVDKPVVQPEEPLEKGDYICAIGGNGRDYQVLMAAMSKLPDIPLVIVVRPNNLKDIEVPPNVKVLVNLPFPEAMNILKYSRFMVLPLKSTQIPCGHVTIVAAMHLGKAFIVTNSIGVKDYVIDDYNAISCEASNVDILADKIQQLWQEPEKAQILGENGYKFAQENCVEEVALNHLCNLLKEKELLRD